MMFMVTSLSINAHTGQSLYEGKCGDNINYVFNKKTGELVISGHEMMYNYSPKAPCPWESDKESIKSLKVRCGVIIINNYAFIGCKNLTSIETF